MDNINRFLDKLGLYDFFAILLAGTITLAISLVANSIYFHFVFDVNTITDIPFLFFLFSYLLGIVLQEIGGLLSQLLRFKKYTLKKALNTERKNYLLSKFEKDAIYIAATEHLLNLKREQLKKTQHKQEQLEEANLENEVRAELDDNDFLYNLCRRLVGSDASAEKYHYTATMSRSLAVYFLLFSIAVLIIAPNESTVANADISLPILFGIAACLSVLLWIRSIRFYEMKYIRYFRLYHYRFIEKEKNKQKNENSQFN